MNDTTGTPAHRDHDRDWWRDSVIYQIYPRSFDDASGDGVGDLRGITRRLDYLQWLGVDAVWLSPVNRSPMYDFGYDVSDYRDIEPVFGTPGDFKKLVAEAHRRGIRVLMDLVCNHTSHLHPWFLESRSSRTNPKRDWYLWHEAVRGKAPNNWLAAFGGSAWEWDEPTGQYYLHSFLKEQPDLNWRSPALRAAFFGEIRYWLDSGVDGFRLDVINYIVKDADFRDNPFGLGPTPRPYDLQRHRYDRNRPESHEILRELRELLDSYGALSVGEVYSEPPGDPALSAAYLGLCDELHLAFDFSLLYSRFGAARFRRCVERMQSLLPAGGWGCTVLSNHDQPRAYSRYGAGRMEERGKLLAAMLLTLRGTPFLYYGEEIGMRDGRIGRARIMDPVGKRYWPFHHGRDPERTPMQWTAGRNAGFSTGEPWLPVNGDYRTVNVAAQQEDPSSMLAWYRGLLSLRRGRKSLRRGDWIPLDVDARVFAYLRVLGEEKSLVLLNFSRGTRRVRLDESLRGSVLLGTHREKNERFGGGIVQLSGYEALVGEMWVARESNPKPTD